jgi:extradiol dioxygenase family protein
MSIKLSPFHVALVARDIQEATKFYSELLGCNVGRSDEDWVDFDMYGHQYTVHLDPDMGTDGTIKHQINPVDGHGVPTPHFGAILPMPEWQKLADSLQDKVDFIIEPYIRFKGEPGEQATMFFYDPSGNALEFKGFTDIATQLFATE